MPSARRRTDYAGRDAADGAVAAAGDDDGGARTHARAASFGSWPARRTDDLGVTSEGAKEIDQLGVVCACLLAVPAEAFRMTAIGAGSGTAPS